MNGPSWASVNREKKHYGDNRLASFIKDEARRSGGKEKQLQIGMEKAEAECMYPYFVLRVP